MSRNPYSPEVVGAFLFAPLVLGVETWRRWGDLLAPEALDDWLVFGSALVVARMLARRDPRAPVLWVFVCGGAWFLMCLSTWGSIHWRGRADPSGVPIAGVLAFKATALVLVSVASVRALRRARLDRPYE